MTPPTISGLERAFACAASVVTPHVRSADTEHRHTGVVVHGFLRDCNLLGRDEALARAPEEYRRQLAAIDVSKFPVDPERFAPEVAYAFDVATDTAVELYRGDDSRRYPEGAWLLCGTLDVVGLADDAVVVGDFKGPHAELTPAKDNWQLRAGALAAARANGRSRALVFLCRVREDGEPVFDWAEFGLVDLDSFALQIRALWERLDGLTPDATVPAEGPWCGYCPAFSRCAAKGHLAAQLGRGDFEALPVLDASNARAIYERAKAARVVLDRVDAVLEEYARAHPVDLGGGYVYGEVERPKESLDPVLAEPVLKAAGLGGAIVLVPTLTKSALSAEIRAQVVAKYPGPKPRGILGNTEKEVLGKLREVGAATTAHQRIVTKHKPKAPKLPATALPNSSGEAPTTPQSAEAAEVRPPKHGAGQPSLEVIQGGVDG